MAYSQGRIDLRQVGWVNNLQLAHVESRTRAEIHLDSLTNIFNDPVNQPGLSASRPDPVVIGGSLYFTAANGSVGQYASAEVPGLTTNNALIVAAIGAGATVNATVGGNLALAHVGKIGRAHV